MADYDWFSHSGPYRYECCQSDVWHDVTCENHPQHGESNRKRREFLELRWSQGFKHMEGDLWACHRGCGCVVFDPEVHMTNVCIRSVDDAT